MGNKAINLIRRTFTDPMRNSNLLKEATGIDLADIVKADTYDAKVNRNVNVSGIDSVNLVVKDEKENPTT